MNGSRRFEGKTALVIGARGAIGQAVGARLEAEGAEVLAADVGSPPAGQSFATLDVTSASDLSRLGRSLVERGDGIDALVYCSGVLRPGGAGSTSAEDWRTTIAVNLEGALRCFETTLPHLRASRGANAVFVASIVGLRGNARSVAYAASKGGLVALTYALALDHAAAGLRINCVCPGTIEGPMADSFWSDDSRGRERSIAKHLIGRLGRADEVAAAVAFLASDDASFVTGVALPVDGGRNIA